MIFSRNSAPEGEDGLWRIQPDGSAASQVSVEAGGVSETSPDGRYSMTVVAGRGYGLVRLEDGLLLPTPDFFRFARPRWSVEDGVTYLWGLGREAVVRMRFDPATGRLGAVETVVPEPAELYQSTLGVARDGSAAVVSQVVFRGQLVRVDGLAALATR